MGSVLVKLKKIDNEEYIYEYIPKMYREDCKGLISINEVTGEEKIIELDKNDFGYGYKGHALSIIREFYENKDFKETGSRIWG